jgi:hypothetical protein
MALTNVVTGLSPQNSMNLNLPLSRSPCQLVAAVAPRIAYGSCRAEDRVPLGKEYATGKSDRYRQEKNDRANNGLRQTRETSNCLGAPAEYEADGG